MKIERLHLMLGLVWLLLGMGLGEAMGRSGDHGQMPTHAHIMMVGGVLPILWAMLYRVFGLAQGLVAWIHFALHHGGALVMFAALYLLYGDLAAPETVGPILGIAAFVVIAGQALMIWLAFAATGDKPTAAEPAAAE